MEYIIWIDSDDCIEKDYIEKLYVSLKSFRADMAIDIYGNKKIDGIEVIEGEDILNLYLLDQLINMLWSTICLKNLYNGEVFQNYSVGEDNDMIFKLLEKYNIIVRYKSNEYHYNIHENLTMHDDA